MRRALLVVALVITSLTGCKKTPKPTASTTEPSAAPPPVVIAPSPELPVPPVDLLYVTQADIAVSSTVDNIWDFPEHLIDHNVQTAWNGKTGDLAGGWIAVRIPKDAHIDSISITPGFDKVAQDGTDLFTANHRIKRVRVTYDGAPLGEHTLDVESRKAQPIKVDKDGGELKIEVLETLPGTKKQWRELVVSELHVYGRAGYAVRENGERPRVRVGSLDLKPVKHDAYKKVLNGVFASPEEFCKKQKELVAPILEADQEGETYGYGRLRPSCSWKEKRSELKAPFLGLASVEYEESAEITSTLLQTEKGWRLAEPLGHTYHSHLDTGCPVNHYATFITSITQHETTPPSVSVTMQTEMRGQYLEFLVKRAVQICRLEDDVLTCDKPVGIMATEIGGGLPDGRDPFPNGKTDGLPKDAPFTVTPDGHIAIVRGAPKDASSDAK